MLTLATISNVEGILLSSRVTIGGHEAIAYAQMLLELQAEKNRLMAAARVPTVTPAPPEAPVAPISHKAPE